MKRILFALVPLLLLSLLSGCNDTAADQTSSSSTSDKPSSSRATTEQYRRIDCAELTNREVAADLLEAPDLECGLVTVPADWSAPKGGRTFEIAVYRLPATGDAPVGDPVIYLEGGPGGPGFEAVPEFASGSAAYLRKRSDVVVIDQRGVGYSRPALYCPEVMKAEARDGDPVAAHKACHDRLVTAGIRLADFNSHNNALDVAAVAAALGYKRYNLYGLSYGTRLATTVMRDAPDGVRSVVLDSTFPVQVNGFSEVPYSIYWALDQIVANCRVDAACAAAMPDLKSEIENGIERLAANPVGDFTATEYVQALAGSIADESLLALIDVVANGSDAQISDFLGAPDEQAEPAGARQDGEPDASMLPAIAEQPDGMYYAIVCAEELPYLDSKASPALADGFRNTTVSTVEAIARQGIDELRAICGAWDVPPAGKVETEAVSSDIPTLILAGSADQVTPPEWGRIAGRTLTKSQYAEIPRLGHGVLGSNDCVNGITQAFLDRPEQTVDQSCIASLPKVKYALD